MSYIALHTKTSEARVRGAERARCDVATRYFAIALLGGEAVLSDRLVDRWPANFLSKEYAITSLISPFPFAKVAIPGLRDDWFTIQLNTGVQLGTEQMALLARLHGQCEVHAYVPEEERPWLADLIERSVDGVHLRPELGWETVIELLRVENDGYAVWSYSVTDAFPSIEYLPKGHLGHADEGDAFYDMPKAEAWDACLEGLMAAQKPWTQEHFQQVRFGAGESVVHFEAALRSEPKEA